MQSRTSRIALVVAALAIAAVAFLVLRPSDDDGGQAERAGQVNAPQEEASPRDANESATGERGGDSRQRPEPDVPTIEFRDGAPVGGVEEIEVESGGTIEFVVESDTPDEIHIHGYEVTKQVAPDQPARFSFPADLEGVFEVEMHDAGHVLIAELRVTP